MDHNMNFIEALELSVVAIAIVLAILLLIFILLNFFKYLPKDVVNNAAPKVFSAPASVPTSSVMVDDDSEERTVAMIMASIKGQEECGKDVHIKSIERIK